MKLAIIGAMDEETRQIRENMTDARADDLHGVKVVQGRFEGLDTALCSGGVGKVNSAATAQLLVDLCGCDIMINTGIAGNTDARLGVGDVAVGERLVYHDADMTIASHSFPYTDHFSSDPELVSLALECCREQGVRCVAGTIATGDLFVCDSAVKSDIIARTGCCCVEMEGCAVANVAARCGVPFLALRVMSDCADENVADAKYQSILDTDKYCALSLALLARLARRLAERGSK